MLAEVKSMSGGNSKFWRKEIFLKKKNFFFASTSSRMTARSEEVEFAPTR